MSLKIDNLSLKLGSKLILNQISFEVAEDSFTAIIGPNGSGKTSLLKCILGFFPFSGEISFAQTNLKSLTQKTKAQIFSYLPQTKPYSSEFNVLEFVYMSYYPHQGIFSRLERNQKDSAETTLKLCQCWELRDKKLSELSGGELQRTLLAAAILQQSNYLLLDEPTSSLDPKSEKMFFDICKNLIAEKKVKIICSTHALNQAALLSDNIIALKSGKIIKTGSTSEIINKDALKNIYGTDFLSLKESNSERNFVLPAL